MNDLNIDFGDDLDELGLYARPAQAEIPPDPSQAQEKSVVRQFFGTIAGKIVVGIVGTIIGSLIVNLPVVATVLLWICKMALTLFGEPGGSQSLKERAAEASVRGDAVIREGMPDDIPTPPIPKLSVVERVKDGAEKAQAKAATAVIEPVKEQAAEVRDTIRESADRIGDRFSGFSGSGGGVSPGPTPDERPGLIAFDQGRAIPWDELEGGGTQENATGFSGRIQEMKERSAERQLLAAERQAQLNHDDLIRRAAGLGIDHEGKAPDALHTEVIAAEAASAPNAICPLRNCGNLMRLADRFQSGKLKCGRCKRQYFVVAARELHRQRSRSAPSLFGGNR